MSDLDDKLGSILADAMVPLSLPYVDDFHAEVTALIKQAFQDEGYINKAELVAEIMPKVNAMRDIAQDMAELPVTVERIDTMTGQEWYERFEKELQGCVFDEASRNDVNQCWDAAKRAAGLEQ